MWGTGEQWGYRKVCTDVQGAVGIVSLRGGSGGRELCFF